jgi:hypothetical protein
MNLDKVFGASGEGYWKSCFTGISLETHPQLGTQVKVNRSDIRNQLENFDQGLQRTLLLIGMSAKTIAPSVVDPTPHIEANKQAICIHLGIPKRIFDGSERGELSSTQDEGDWDDKLAVYQRTYVDPYWVTPTVDRLIMLGVLAEPGEDGYSASFDDIGATSDREKAEVASLKTQTLAAAIAGNVFSVVPEMEYLTDFTGFMEPDEAEAVLDKAEAREQEMAEMGLNPDGSAPAEIDPETGLPIQPPGDLGAGKFVGATGGEDDEEEGDDEEEDDEEPPPFGVNRPRPKPQE